MEVMAPIFYLREECVGRENGADDWTL